MREEVWSMSNLVKIGLYISLSMLTALLCGCSREESIAPQIELYNNYDTSMEKTIFVEDNMLNVPTAMVYVDDCLYVTSKEGHCVLKYSKEGVLEKTIGGLGNGDGEFRKPVAIASYDKEIYVVDENDGKVQVFDLDGTLKNKYYVSDLDSMYLSVLDIEVNENNIYISVAGGNKKLLYVYILEKSGGEVNKIGKLCMGSLGKGNENEIYFGQVYDYIEDDGYSGYESGSSYISRIVGDKMSELFQLPQGYMPSDILQHNDNIFVFSKALKQVDVFDMQGQYIKTIFSEESSTQNMGMGYMTMDDEGNIYLSDEKNNSIYKLEKKN